MANDIVTLKDHDLRSLIEQLSESRSAVAELVEALREVQTQTLGRPVGGGDGATYTVHPISGDLYNRIQSLLSRHQAGLGKGDDQHG